jgi:polysaccharide biosynthesis/export protein
VLGIKHLPRTLASIALVALCFSSQLFGQSPEVQAGSAASGVFATTNVSSASAQEKKAISAEAEYRIGSQDLMEIVVFGQPELTRTVRVNSAGEISLPLIGSLIAAGLTAQQLEQRVAAMLGEKYLQSPQISVFMKEFTTLRFTVEGAVNKPGVYPLTGQMTLLRALAVAGGQGQLSDLSEVMVFRIAESGERKTFKYDAEKIRGGEVVDPLIQNDDLVVVKRSRARTALRDSLFRDILDTINPIPLLK